MTIREYAKSKDFEIVGKLTRRADWELFKNDRAYMDEAYNEYYKGHNGVCDMCIITNDGAVI